MVTKHQHNKIPKTVLTVLPQDKKTTTTKTLYLKNDASDFGALMGEKSYFSLSADTLLVQPGV